MGRKIITFILMIILISNMLTSCWNYREINDLAIVAGVAIDFTENNNYELTVELVKTQSSGNQSEIISNVISHHGVTIFDAIRNMISIAERKLYWSHAKVFVISKEVAKSSILPIIDFILRDAETRQDMMLVVSNEEKASDILRAAHGKADILSIELYKMIESQEQLSKAPIIPFWEIAKELSEETICSSIPLVELNDQNGEKKVHVGGTAIFYDAKMVGELSEDETRFYLYAVNEEYGGILPVKMHHGDTTIKISLEILDSKTKVKFHLSDLKEPIIDIYTNTEVLIGEVDGDMDPTEKHMLSGIEHLAKKEIEENVTKVCNKVLKEFKSDVFGFAKVIKDNDPNLWRQYREKYDDIKPKIKVNVHADVNVLMSGLIRNRVPMKGE